MAKTNGTAGSVQEATSAILGNDADIIRDLVAAPDFEAGDEIIHNLQVKVDRLVLALGLMEAVRRLQRS